MKMPGSPYAKARAPGKVANCFAVESFTDELVTLVGADPVEFRLRYLKDPRGIDVIRRAAVRFGWTPRARAVDSTASIATGRGFAYVHYKQTRPMPP